MQFSALCNSARGFSPPIFGSFGANNYFGENVKCANFLMPRTPNYDIYIKWTRARSPPPPKSLMAHRFVTKTLNTHESSFTAGWRWTESPQLAHNYDSSTLSTFIQECLLNGTGTFLNVSAHAMPLTLISGGFGAQVQRLNRIYVISRLIMGQHVW